MALTLTPLTELDAVNMMLMSIGQSPVNALDSTGIKDVATAQLWLHNTSREIQSKGWTFNQDFAFPLTPDGNDRIVIPPNALAVDPTNPNQDYVQRYDDTATAMALYDLVKQSPTMLDTVNVDITWFFDYEKTPATFRNYCGLLAGQRFQAGSISSELLFKFEQVDIDRAQVAFERDNTRVGDRNILAGSQFTNQIFKRRRNP